MLSLVLAASLWQAAQTVPLPVTVPIEKFSDALAVDLALNAVGTGLDLISTDWAISRGCKEGNPLAPRVEGRVALKVGAAALRGSVAYFLRRRGHKRFADVWRWAGFGTDLLITGNNVACGTRGGK